MNVARVPVTAISQQHRDLETTNARHHYNHGHSESVRDREKEREKEKERKKERERENMIFISNKQTSDIFIITLIVASTQDLAPALIKVKQCTHVSH